MWSGGWNGSYTMTHFSANSIWFYNGFLLICSIYCTWQCLPSFINLSFLSSPDVSHVFIFLPLLRQPQRSAPLCQRPAQIKQAPLLPPKMELPPQQPVEPLHQRAQQRLFAPVLPLQPKNLWVRQTCSDTDLLVHTHWLSVFLWGALKWFSLWY